jgi:hypothetical protein
MEDTLIQKLTKVKNSGAIVYIDNDTVDAYDEISYTGTDLGMPHELLGALLDEFGVRWEHV